MKGINNQTKIGTLGEKSIHSSLKKWYSKPGDKFEVPFDGFIIDIVRGKLLIEIQTGNFSSFWRFSTRYLIPF